MSERLRSIVADAAMVDVDRALDDLWDSPEFKRMGSEIERAFAAHFVLGCRLRQIPYALSRPDTPTDCVFLAPQVQIGPYRVDFLLGVGKRPSDAQCVVVECDGHDFHDRTPDQAARDKSRDRYLNQRVKAVARFTGREIYRDVDACLADATKILFRERVA